MNDRSVGKIIALSKDHICLPVVHIGDLHCIHLADHGNWQGFPGRIFQQGFKGTGFFTVGNQCFFDFFNK